MAADIERQYFGIVDYVIFALTLALSSAIGIFFAIKSGKNQTTAEYLLANQGISWFPIFVSLVASFFSAVGVMGMPAQIYSTGIAFGLHFLSFLPPIILCAEVFAPIYRQLCLVSANEYLEKRFSIYVRYLGCFFFHLQYTLYLSVVLYAPSLALKSVADIPLTVTIISTGIVCTFYTSLGGMRAVIWTDVFQSAVMMVGLTVTAGIGVSQVGSFSKVFEVAKKWDRLTISFDPDPRVYHSFWGCTIGLSFAIIGTWTTSQPTVQRIVSAKSLSHAKKAIYASFFGVAIIMILLALDALVIFANYAECDLIKNGKITQYDQILPYFVVNELGYLTGISGLFTACLFSFALSTLSSGLNGMSAIFYDDVIRKVKPNMSEESATKLTKIVAVVDGLFITGFAFIVPKLGKFVLKLTIQLFGIIGGPYFAMFALGIFTTSANACGALVGGFVGFIVGFLYAVGQLYYPPARHLPPVLIRGCSHFNTTLSNTTGIIYPKDPSHSDPFSKLFSISYVWHGLICISITYVVGYLVSLCTQNFFERRFLSNLTYNYSENWLIKKIRRKQKGSQSKENVFLTRLDEEV